MDALWRSPIIITRRILQIVGIWPYLTNTQYVIRTIIMNVSVLSIYIVQVHSVLSMKFTMDKLSLFYVDNFIANTFMTLTYYICLFQRAMGRSCLEQMILDWKVLENTKELNILLDYASLCRTSILTIIFTCFGIVSFAFFIPSMPLILDILVPLNETRSRTLLYRMDWFPENEKYFVELLLLQYFLCLLMGLGCVSGLSSYLVFLQHICAMFRVIECLLDNILEEDEIELSVVDNNAVYAKIIRIIGFHDTTTNFVDVLNRNFSLFALLGSVFGTFIAGLRIMQVLAELERNSDFGNLIIPVIQIVFLLVWIFTFCFIGQHMLDVSSSIFNKTYETPWYLMSTKMQKLLYILMIRSGRASYISIGKMFIASHEAFSALMQVVLSYSTILYSQHKAH